MPQYDLQAALEDQARRERERQASEGEARSAGIRGFVDRNVGEPMRRVLFPTDAEQELRDAEQAASSFRFNRGVNVQVPSEIRSGIEGRIALERRDNPNYTGVNSGTPSAPPGPMDVPKSKVHDALADSLSEGRGDSPFGLSSAPSRAALIKETPKREPLSVRYKNAKNEWKTHILGEEAPQDIARSNTAFDPSTGTTERVGAYDDKGNRSSAAGGVSTTDMDSLPIGQRPPSFMEDEQKLTGLAETRAQRALAELLQNRPFAKEEAAAARDVNKAQEIARFGSGLKMAEERTRMKEYQDQVGRVSAWRQEQMARAAQLPPEQQQEALARIEDTYEAKLEEIKMASGFATRLSSAVR